LGPRTWNVIEYRLQGKSFLSRFSQEDSGAVFLRVIFDILIFLFEIVRKNMYTEFKTNSADPESTQDAVFSVVIALRERTKFFLRG
jgi:hypothetical protein